MKILFMCLNLTGGGAERVCASWANGTVKLGHDVSILADLHTKMMYSVDDRVKLIQLYKSKNSSRVMRYLPTIFYRTRQMYKLCKENSYDAVVSVGYLNWKESKIACSLLKNAPKLVMTDHNSFERPNDACMPFRTKLKKFVWSRLFDCFTVLTNADLSVAKRKGLRNVSVLYNPLFLAPSLKSLPYKQKIVLSMGRMDIWHCKGFDLLVTAWNRVSAKHPDWKLKIVGKGDDKTLTMLKSLSKDLNSIEFLPYTSNPAALYEEASIYVLSSRYEGWGLVMVEAMSQGCATIACDYKGRQSEVITDGENGLLCDVGNADAIAEKIELLIENDELRTRIQRTAPSSVERFSEDKVAKRLVELIESAR
jgi:glycosyltransferase involved in cell wall biosynthesis